jgi:hypothetical protein
VISALIAFGLTSFVYVGLRAIQQLNVQHEKRMFIVPSSLGMAACEFFLIVKTVHLDTPLVILFGGTGAGLGCLCAMTLHKHLRERNLKNYGPTD